MFQTNYSSSRVKLSHAQTAMLSDFFMYNPKPGSRERQRIADQLGIGEDKVKNWFQNRRAKERQDNLEEQNIPKKIINIENIYKVFPQCNDLYRRRDNFTNK